MDSFIWTRFPALHQGSTISRRHAVSSYNACFSKSYQLALKAKHKEDAAPSASVEKHLQFHFQIRDVDSSTETTETFFPRLTSPASFQTSAWSIDMAVSCLILIISHAGTDLRQSRHTYQSNVVGGWSTSSTPERTIKTHFNSRRCQTLAAIFNDVTYGVSCSCCRSVCWTQPPVSHTL